MVHIPMTVNNLPVLVLIVALILCSAGPGKLIAKIADNLLSKLVGKDFYIGCKSKSSCTQELGLFLEKLHKFKSKLFS